MKKSIKLDAGGLFREEYLNKLKRDRFTGKMIVSWKEGEIRFLKMSTNFVFAKSKRDEDDLFFEEL